MRHIIVAGMLGASVSMGCLLFFANSAFALVAAAIVGAFIGVCVGALSAGDDEPSLIAIAGAVFTALVIFVVAGIVISANAAGHFDPRWPAALGLIGTLPGLAFGLGLGALLGVDGGDDINLALDRTQFSTCRQASQGRSSLRSIDTSSRPGAVDLRTETTRSWRRRNTINNSMLRQSVGATTYETPYERRNDWRTARQDRTQSIVQPRTRPGMQAQESSDPAQSLQREIQQLSKLGIVDVKAVDGITVIVLQDSADVPAWKVSMLCLPSYPDSAPVVTVKRANSHGTFDGQSDVTVKHRVLEGWDARSGLVNAVSHIIRDVG